MAATKSLSRRPRSAGTAGGGGGDADGRRPVAAGPDQAGALRRAVGRNLTAYGFLSGALACFALFSWYPMVREVVLSLQENNFVDPEKWAAVCRGCRNRRTGRT